MNKHDNNQIDWNNLGFNYIKTDYNVRCTFANGGWGDIVVSDSEQVNLHMAATCLHYGQEIFEGQKAFRGRDGKMRLFRIDENAKRLQHSARGIMMEPVPVDIFTEMAKRVVKLNERFVPPYGSGCSLYLRPFEIGTTARVGVNPATDYLFIIFTTPVGAYFKEGFNTTQVCITRQYDRAAPQGTGRFKVGGNYAASLRALDHAKQLGYSTVLFLDPKEKKYIDECGPANFFAIKGDTYITPQSGSILPSITNMCLQQIARDMGLKVECRPIEPAELETVDEAAECGTAAVCSPLSEIHDLDTGKKYVVAQDGKPGPVVTELYHRLQAVQMGDAPDNYGWVTIIE